MGEHVRVGDSIGYAYDPWEFNTGDVEQVPAEAVQAITDLLIENYDVHEHDVEELLGNIAGILGPAIVATFLRDLIRRNGALFMGIADTQGVFRQVLSDQDARLARRL